MYRVFWWSLLLTTVVGLWLKADSQTAKQHYYMARSYHATGKLQQALYFYQAAIEADPHMALAYRALAYLHVERGDYRQAVMVLSAYLALQPDHIEFYYHRAYIYSMLNQPKLALKDWNTMLKYDPLSIEALWSRAHYYLQHKQYQAALDDFLLLDQHDTDEAAISRFYLAITLEHLGRHAESAALLQEYLPIVQAVQAKDPAVGPPLGRVYYLIARNLRLSGQHEEAAVYYSLAIQYRLWLGATTAILVEVQMYSNNHLHLRRR